VKGELLWLLHDDVFPGWIPPNHMMVFQTLEKPAQKNVRRGQKEGRKGGTRGRTGRYSRVKLCEKGCLGLGMAGLVGFWGRGLVWLFLGMVVIRRERARGGLGLRWLLLLLLLLVLVGCHDCGVGEGCGLIKLIGLRVSRMVGLRLLLPRGIRGGVEVSHEGGMDDEGEIWRRRRVRGREAPPEERRKQRRRYGLK
jgi:hypothetical protein